MKNLELLGDSNIELTKLMLSLAIGLALSLLAKYQYVYFGQSPNNKDRFSDIFIGIVLTTIIIISLIKSSIALSLGLIGALSIVRFRTPIKEPEELGYLFLCIALGLGLGANQHIATSVAGVVILAVLTLLRLVKRASDANMFLSIEINQNTQTKEVLDKITELLTPITSRLDLRKVDKENGFTSLIFLIETRSQSELLGKIESIENIVPGSKYCLIDNTQTPRL